MEKIKEIVCIGGGTSISEGLSLGLKNYLKDKFVLGCNYSFRHFDLTALCFCDGDFYLPTFAKKEENKKKYPNIFKDLSKLPLIIGALKNPALGQFKHPNTILVKRSGSTFSPNPIKDGFMGIMCGAFALQVALLFEPERIYLLGYDFGELNKKRRDTQYSPEEIHYYGKEIVHKGSKWIGFFNNHSPDNYFKWFENSKSKIYNVSPASNIQNFEKIDYTTMFELLDNVVYNQEEIREKIKRIIQIK